MGFAQTGAAIDEQRVVGPPRVFSDLQAGGAGQLVRVAFDEGGEGEIRIEIAALEQFGSVQGFFARLFHRGRRLGRRRWREGIATAADFQHHARALFQPQPLQHCFDLRQMVFLDPVEHETVGRQQVQDVAFFLTVQRTNPGAELLFSQFAFQALQTVFPQGVVHSVVLLWSLGIFIKTLSSWRLTE